MPMHTVIEVAKTLGVHRQHVLDLIRTLKLRAINIALPGAIRPSYRITDEAIEDFMRGNTTAAATAPPRRKKKATGKANYF